MVKDDTKDEEDVPHWIGANGSALKPMSPNSQLRTMSSSDEDQNVEHWYDKRFPIVVAAKEWEIGRSRASLLPSRRKSGRVRIAIRRKSDKPLGIHGYRDLEEGSVLSDWSQLIIDGDVIVFNVLKQETPGASGNSLRNSGTSNLRNYNSGYDQEYEHQPPYRPTTGSSVSTIGFAAVDDRFNPLMEAPDNWVVKHSSPISKVFVKRDNNRCIATMGNIYNNSKEEVSLFFFSETEAKVFIKFLGELKRIHRNVAKNAMKNSLENRSSTSTVTDIKFLIEIISATDLKAVNRRSSDPYVVVSYGGEKVHKTDVVKKNLDPIWTIGSKSLFIFTLHPEDYYHSELLFEVRDFETFVPGSSLGQALLSNRQLMAANGQRIELKLKYLQLGEDAQGYLAIRCKRATANEIEFIENPTKKNLHIKKKQRAYIQPLYSKQNPLLQFQKVKVIKDVKHYLVRPMHPSGEVKWMSESQIDEMSQHESENWTEAGSGSLGEIFVEIISCDDLPNLDRGLPANKTDAFATLVLEDTAVTTDVVRDCLNPRFMPWTRRAFKLNIQHSSSPLFIGVFDHDQFGRHDPVGRVAIPLQQFHPQTEYRLSYDLYDSAEVIRRRARGKINIRISIKWKQRKCFFDALGSKEQFTVNIDSKSNYRHAEYTILGYADQKEYNLKTVMSYADELVQYQDVVYTIVDALKTLLLWRGHFEVTLCFCIRFKLPLHSLTMLTFAIILTEYPQYSVSVYFASVAWFMLALLENRRKRPSSWNRPPRYISLILRLLSGGSRPQKILPNENKEEDVNFRDRETARIENSKFWTAMFWQRLSDDLNDLDQVKSKTLYSESMEKPMRLEIFKNQVSLGVVHPSSSFFSMFSVLC